MNMISKKGPKKCPFCEQGTLKKSIIEEEMFGVSLGQFPAQVCSQCQESFTDEATTREIEEVAKMKGIWGLEKKTSISRSGNSLAVRIPKSLVNYLHVREGEAVYLHPEGRKLVIEPAENK